MTVAIDVTSCLAILLILRSTTGGEQDQRQGTQDGQQKSMKQEQADSNKTKASQLVQEEKAESGNVSTSIHTETQCFAYNMNYSYVCMVFTYSCISGYSG